MRNLFHEIYFFFFADYRKFNVFFFFDFACFLEKEHTFALRRCIRVETMRRSENYRQKIFLKFFEIFSFLDFGL